MKMTIAWEWFLLLVCSQFYVLFLIKRWYIFPGAVFIATCVGGPAVLVAGLKLGAFAAIGGGIMGYTTGKMFFVIASLFISI